jgi:hypothetical protein
MEAPYDLAGRFDRVLESARVVSVDRSPGFECVNPILRTKGGSQTKIFDLFSFVSGLFEPARQERR